MCAWVHVTIHKCSYMCLYIIKVCMDSPCDCVWKLTPAGPQGGNKHYHDTWGVTVYWNLKYVSHHNQNTEQCLYNSHVMDTTGTQRNKKPNNHNIGDISWVPFHSKDLSGLSHDWNKETECIKWKALYSKKGWKNKAYIHVGWHTYFIFIRGVTDCGKIKKLLYNL